MAIADELPLVGGERQDCRVSVGHNQKENRLQMAHLSLPESVSVASLRPHACDQRENQSGSELPVWNADECRNDNSPEARVEAAAPIRDPGRVARVFQFLTKPGTSRRPSHV
jgi:hypothetical protein